MGSEPTTTLTVAKLKALCVLTTSQPVEKRPNYWLGSSRLGVDKETLGIEVYDESTSTFQPASEDEPSDEPVMMSLEDDEPVEPVPLPSSDEDDADEDDVLEAEILEADLIDDEPLCRGFGRPFLLRKPQQPLSRKNEDGGALTLMEMVRRPNPLPSCSRSSSSGQGVGTMSTTNLNRSRPIRCAMAIAWGT